MRGDSAINRISESLQSIGLTEEMRSFAREVRSRIDVIKSSDFGGRSLGSLRRSRPQRPRLIPEITTSRYPASTKWFTSRKTSSSRNDRLRPRTEGIMQNEHRLLHPS